MVSTNHLHLNIAVIGQPIQAIIFIYHKCHIRIQPSYISLLSESSNTAVATFSTALYWHVLTPLIASMENSGIRGHCDGCYFHYMAQTRKCQCMVMDYNVRAGGWIANYVVISIPLYSYLSFIVPYLGLDVV